jgi:hypothetical protein
LKGFAAARGTVKQQMTPDLPTIGCIILDNKAAHDNTESRTLLSLCRVTLVVIWAELVAVVMLSGKPFLPDSAGLLDCARRLLDGAVPYVDYLTLQVQGDYLHVLPVLVSRIFGADLESIFNLMVLATVLYSCIISFYWLSTPSFDFSATSRVLLIAIWAASSLYALERGYFGGDFGQREQLFALTFVPWLVCRAARYSGDDIKPGPALLVGLIAGPFVLLKPHFCFVAAAVEGLCIFRTRRFSHLYTPELLALLLWGMAFGLHFLFVPASMIEAMFCRWIPYILAGYGAYDCGVTELTNNLFWPSR